MEYVAVKWIQVIDSIHNSLVPSIVKGIFMHQKDNFNNRGQFGCLLSRLEVTFLSVHYCVCNIHRRVALTMFNSSTDGSLKSRNLQHWLKHCWSISGCSKKFHFTSWLVSEHPVSCVLGGSKLLRNSAFTIEQWFCKEAETFYN